MCVSMSSTRATFGDFFSLLAHGSAWKGSGGTRGSEAARFVGSRDLMGFLDLHHLLTNFLVFDISRYVLYTYLCVYIYIERERDDLILYMFRYYVLTLFYIYIYNVCNPSRTGDIVYFHQPVQPLANLQNLEHIIPSSDAQ